MLGYKNLVLLALVALAGVNAAADEKDCEGAFDENDKVESSRIMCVKVVDDVKGVFATLSEKKAGGKKLDIAENAIGKHCASKALSSKDKKLCYFLEPLKKDVARQVTYGKDSYKVCKALEKKNPDFCSMRYPTKTDVNTDYTKLRVKQLKKILAERNVECVGCVEKEDFIKKIKETESQHSEL
ncbi:hypothetical protein PybrP1_008438 [[Pythium] brassicae (nom. inval.)]|nr:hypothetical protein PybrP1_008438 [[Pythium] brassicae (nom. inval.)]